jgi:hypothetical protein
MRAHIRSGGNARTLPDPETETETTDMTTTDILSTARHERAAAEHMAECCARIASGESSADPAWIKSTVADLRATLADWRRLAREVEAVPELEGVAMIHADTRRLMACSIEHLASVARGGRP